MVRLMVLLLLLVPASLRAQDAPPWNPDGNGDGCITTSDLVLLLSVFGLCPEPTPVDCPDSDAFSCHDTVYFDNYGYPTVLIGEQCWFAENLRTTAYQNGDAIPAGLDDENWQATTEGAAVVYGAGSSDCEGTSPDIDPCDDTQTLAAYGRMYNWFAVNDARGLCPSGWHTPTNGEWTALEGFISGQGFSGSAGSALKSNSGWMDNGNGTDDFGFSALPGGFRSNSDGGFSAAGAGGFFWTSTPSGGDASTRILYNNFAVIITFINDPHRGFSVRCLQDN
jgi:uncharacterized protein (TIGR02145 family)